MNLETLYSLIIEHYRKSHMMYIGKKTVGTHALQWWLALYNPNRIPEEYRLSWKDDKSYGHLVWAGDENIYKWVQ